MDNPILPLVIIGLGTALYVSATLVNNPSEESIIAKQIIEAKENLADYADLKAINLKGMKPPSETQIAQSDISKIIVPSKSYNKEAILSLGKYQRAVNVWFESNDPAIDPTCDNLDTMNPKIISLSECNNISAIDFDFFEYNDGAIAFKTDDAIATELSKLPNAPTQVDSANEKTSFIQKDTPTSFNSLMFKRTILHQANLQKKIDSTLSTSPLIAAKLNAKLAASNPNLALSNSSNIIKSVERNPSLSSDDNKSIAQHLHKAAQFKLLKENQKQITTVDATNIATSNLSKISTFVDSNLEPAEKLLIEEEIHATDTDTNGILYDLRINQ